MTAEITPLSLDSIVSRSQDILAADMGGETVMLDMQQNAYFGMDSLASLIWEMLAEPVRVSDLCAALQAKFSVEAEECQRDVLDLLTQIQTWNLLNVHPG
jgi:hypothetical protein